MLTVSKGGESGLNRFVCPTCPYEFPISGVLMYSRKDLARKEVDDVLGGDGAWDNVDQTGAQCPVEDCGSDRAYFFQLQIRSADEPMTTFYKVSDGMTSIPKSPVTNRSVSSVVQNGEKTEKGVYSFSAACFWAIIYMAGEPPSLRACMRLPRGLPYIKS